MKNMKILLAAAIGMLTVGCYNDFDTPAPERIWSVTEVEQMGLKHMTIKDLKSKFIENFGSLEDTGTNDNWATTNTLKLGAPANDIEAGFESDPGNIKFWADGADYYIKGKVISSDQQGNVYKSLYIDDGTGAIELKLSGTLYTLYKLELDRMDSQWVYVKLKDFYLGNYRMMLSLGDAPSNGLNTGLREKFYANSNFESANLWRNQDIPEFNRVLRGEACQLVKASIDDNNPDANVIAVNTTNYNKLGQDYYGRLVYFEGVTIQYANITYQDEQRDAQGNIERDADGNIIWGPDITAPTFGTNGDPYPNWVVTDSGSPIFAPWFHWAYSRNGVNLYGSVLMLLNNGASGPADPGAYTIRTSGYSRFGMRSIPRNGTKGNVLGIYGIYSKNLRGFQQYQITVSRIEDLEFPEESLLSQEWIDHNTPGNPGTPGDPNDPPTGSYNPPVKDGAGEYE